MNRELVKEKNRSLFKKYAELTDEDMFYLEGKNDEYVNKVQSLPERATREILNENNKEQKER